MRRWLTCVHRYLCLLGRQGPLAPEDQPSLSSFAADIGERNADTSPQIVTGSSDGSIHVLYSPLTSLKGVTTAVTRAPRARAPDDFSSSSALDRPIIAPHSLPMFKDDYGDASAAGGRGGKRRRERERHDPQKTMKPSTFLGFLRLGWELIKVCSAACCWTWKGRTRWC